MVCLGPLERGLRAMGSRMLVRFCGFGWDEDMNFFFSFRREIYVGCICFSGFYLELQPRQLYLLRLCIWLSSYSAVMCIINLMNLGDEEIALHHSLHLNPS